MLRRLDAALRAGVTPRPVVITRVMLGLALAIASLEMSGVIYGISEGALAYPVFEWAPRPTETLALGLLVVGWIAAASLVLGVLPRIMAALGAAVGLLTLLWDQQTYSSHLTLLTILLALLVFAGSGEGWTLLRRRPRGASVPFWPQLLMMTQVSVVYLFAGLSKAQPTFLGGDPLQGWMWPDLSHWMFVALAWMTVMTEVSLAFALWMPRVRVLAAVLGVALHLSIVTLLDEQRLWLVAFALTTTAVYPLFLTRPPLRELAAQAAVADASATEVTG